jgi:Barstar (barnase inhibitor)
LRNCGSNEVAVLEIDGASLSSIEDLFKAFAIALRKPKGWYGDEDYATNQNAFLEYLDDVVEWIPAKGHVILIRGSEQLWRAVPRLAGVLTELWQCATVTRQAAIHLIFVW